jgi:hypothetical protein
MIKRKKQQIKINIEDSLLWRDHLRSILNVLKYHRKSRPYGSRIKNKNSEQKLENSEQKLRNSEQKLEILNKNWKIPTFHSEN